jgi:predicted nucleic acid-binding protein
MNLAYVDSSVWIVRFEGLPLYKKIVNDWLTRLGKDGWMLCISEAVILEIMPKPYRNNDISVIDAYNEVFEQTKILKSFPNVFKDALKISQTENLKAMDSVHLAIAKHHACERFVSTDPHFKNLKAISPMWIDLNK